MALGEVFVGRAFSAEAQSRALQLVSDVKASMQHRIENLTWMSDPTKKRALGKLAAMVPKIGAPDKFPTYDGLALKADDYAGNFLRAAAWTSAKQMADLDRLVDRTRWSMSPYIVNASAGGLNEITFPAGILQPGQHAALACVLSGHRLFPIGQQQHQMQAQDQPHHQHGKPQPATLPPFLEDPVPHWMPHGRAD